MATASTIEAAIDASGDVSSQLAIGERSSALICGVMALREWGVAAGMASRRSRRDGGSG
ncbi:hypothetical protein D3C83_315180 [compost metagenome]